VCVIDQVTGCTANVLFQATDTGTPPGDRPWNATEFLATISTRSDNAPVTDSEALYSVPGIVRGNITGKY